MQNCVRVFGIPMDLGQRRRGVDMGPSAIRYAGLDETLERLGFQVCDAGNIFVPQVEEMGLHDVEVELADGGRAYYLKEVSQICQEIYDEITAQLKPEECGIFLGGDHSMSIGTVSAVAKPESIGVLWVDAHADMNSPRTTPSGNIHGMSVASLLGDGPSELTDIGYPGPKLKPEQVAMIGLRNLDSDEKLKVSETGILAYTMRELDELGMSVVARNVVKYFERFEHIHVSLDLDSCDPTIAPGVGTPVMGGLSYREAHLLMEILSDSGKVRTVDVVEVNPILDNQNATGKVAVELVASLFGKRII
jgi:arginase